LWKLLTKQQTKHRPALDQGAFSKMLEVQQCFPSETFGNGGFSLWDPPSKAVQLDRFSSGDLSTDCGPPRITNPIACAVAGDLDGLEVRLGVMRAHAALLRYRRTQA
jgi:hypothetical protein